MLIGYCSEDGKFPSIHFITPAHLFIVHSLLGVPHSRYKQRNCVLHGVIYAQNLLSLCFELELQSKFRINYSGLGHRVIWKVLTCVWKEKFSFFPALKMEAVDSAETFLQSGA